VINPFLRRLTASLWRAGSAAMRAKDTVANAMSFHRGDSLHIAKTTLAAVLAWAGARWLTMAVAAVWMGPATAVVVVQATVYRSLANGVRRVVAVTAGALIAGLVGRLLGLNPVSLLVIVPSALLVARWRRIGDRSSDIVTTAVFMLSYGASAAHEQYLRDYIVQTAMGAIAGMAVNLLIPPPLKTGRLYGLMKDLAQDTAELLCRIGDGLRDGYEAADVRDWQREADDLDGRLGDATEAIRHGSENRLFNVRRWRSAVPAPQTYAPLLRAMRLIMPSVSSIIRALDRPDDDEPGPDINEIFAHAYAELLRLTATAITAQGRNPAASDADAHTQFAECLEKADTIQGRVTDLVRSGEMNRPTSWAVSGSLLIDAERILSTLNRCAEALAVTS
jgi:hypothetical protein